MRTKIGDSISMFLDLISLTILSESGRAAFSLIGSTPMLSVLQPDNATAAPSAADTRRARTIGLRFKRKLPQRRQAVPEPACSFVILKRARNRKSRADTSARKPRA